MSVAIALPAPAVEAGSAWGLPGWFTLILRKVRRAMLSEEERRLLELVEFGASTFGKKLLEAESLDDLDDRIEILLETPEFATFYSQFTGPLPSETMARIPINFELTPEVREVFGEGTKDLLHEGFELSFTSARGVYKLLDTLGDEDRSRFTDEARSVNPLDLLSRPEIPPAVAQSILDGLKAGACMFAIIEAVLSEKALESWLSRAIAQRWVALQQSYLRFLASIPEAQVPYDVVPAEKRMDLEALAKKSQNTHERFLELAQKAKQAETDIFPTHVDPDDD